MPADRNQSIIEQEKRSGGTFDRYYNSLHKVAFDIPYRWTVSEATGEKLAVTETGMDGSIKEHPVECDALKIAGPKRQGEVVTMSLAK